MPRVKSKKRLLVVSWVLIAAGIILAVIGGTVAWHQHQQNETAGKKAAAAEYRANHGHATGSTPSTKKPSWSQTESYQTKPDYPRLIYIPKIDVVARVKPTWQTKAGAIGSPTNIYDTAWYVHSAKPGGKGAMLIDGHVGFWTKHGIFFNLKKLQPGDKIKVERGDGKMFNYKVIDKQTYPSDKVNMKKVLAPINPNKPGLNLITCAGDIIKGTNKYDKRVVIFAEQVK